MGAAADRVHERQVLLHLGESVAGEVVVDTLGAPILWVVMAHPILEEEEVVVV
jgi:hypothetical protein